MAVISNKQKALQNLAGQLPVASQRAAQGQAAARDMQLQAAVAKAPTAAPAAMAQQTGAAIATQAGGQAVQNAQQAVQTGGQVGQLALGQQAQENQAAVASQAAGAKQEQMDQVQQFAQLNEGLKKSLYDETMKFQTDELGRTQFNEIQLADYARSNAKSDEQYKDYAQKAQMASKRRLQAMEHAYKILDADLKQKQAIAEQRADQRTTLEIAETRKQAAAAMQREKNREANRNAAWSAGGTILGTTAGAFTGNPQMAAAGGNVGGGVGSSLSKAFGG